MTEPTFPSPPPSPESREFYAAAAEGRFMVPRCTTCRRTHWYPRACCPFCFGPAVLEPASGRGTIYSFSVMRRATPPTTIAYVTLEEGPTMLTSLVDCDVDAVRIGQTVELTWKIADDGTKIPCFKMPRPGATA